MKLYEITNTNYVKHYVRGIKSDKEAKQLGKKVFGKYLFDINYYKEKAGKNEGFTKGQFLKLKKRYK